MLVFIFFRKWRRMFKVRRFWSVSIIILVGCSDQTKEQGRASDSVEVKVTETIESAAPIVENKAAAQYSLTEGEAYMRVTRRNKMSAFSNPDCRSKFSSREMVDRLVSSRM